MKNTKKNTLKVGDEVFDGIYFTANDPGVVKELRTDNFVNVGYKVGTGLIGIPLNRITKL